MILRNIAIAVSGVVYRTTQEIFFHDGAGIATPFADANTLRADSTSYRADNY